MITIIYYMEGDLSEIQFITEAEMNEWLSDWGECKHFIVRGTDYDLENHT